MSVTPVDKPPGAGAEFPPRPDGSVLSESIPLFYIARNRSGFWVAREAAGQRGGMFLFKRSALRFAAKHGAPVGCATMLLAQRVELDVENQGNPFVAAVNAVVVVASRSAPRFVALIAGANAAAHALIGGERR